MNDARVAYASETLIETQATAGTFTAAATPLLKKIRVDNKEASTTNPFGITYYDAKVVKAAGGIEYKNFTVSETTPTTYTIASLAAGDKVVYKSAEFQQETVPAEKIPGIKPVMKRIALTAEPRRIAVKYDQITAYQAKTDYGFSLDKQIAEQACGELAY